MSDTDLPIPELPPPEPKRRNGLAWTGFGVGIAGFLAAVVMLGVLVTTDKKEPEPIFVTPAADYRATADGFLIEPPDKVGPDAFTLSVVSEEGTSCDKEKFISQLDTNPVAKSEWARVLGVRESEVDTFVKSLVPEVLSVDTRVTNHGLRDGKAYSRPSLLEKGTVVLTGDPTKPVPTSTPEAAGATETAIPGGKPVLRCRCGNPLLPAYQPSADATATISPSPSPSPSPTAQARSTRTPTRTPTTSPTRTPTATSSPTGN